MANISLYVFVSPGSPFCCTNSCGRIVQLVANGAHNNLNDGGKTIVNFNLEGSVACGVLVTEVLGGKLGGLVGRDELAKLTPNSQSMRLKFEVSNRPPLGCPS
jgi:hypothetical protein